MNYTFGMKLRNIFVLAVIVFALGSLAVREFRSPKSDVSKDERSQKENTTLLTPGVDSRVRVTHPQPNEIMASPYTFDGEARGTWFFEASFPVRVEDTAGNILGRGYAQAEGEWMTEEFVPFRGTVEFISEKDQLGRVVFEKDNPSGLPEHAAETSVPVQITKKK